jgi:short-subunit dehydrogenase
MRMAKESAPKQTRGARRRALVTGASVGIGAAFAERLAGNGHDLVVVARNRDRLDELAKRLHKDHGAHVEVLPADLTEAAELRVVEHLVEDANLDLLINNAGFGTVGSFSELEVDREEEEIRLNVVALVRLTRAALPGMVARRAGAVINVSSMAGFQPDPYNATYGATKAFVNSFTEALYEELRGTGVRVQALCPGFTRTEFQARAGVNVSDVPALLWMSPAAVAEASLDSLQRGDLICIPGLANRAMMTVTSALPRSLTRRVMGTMGRRISEAG